MHLVFNYYWKQPPKGSVLLSQTLSSAIFVQQSQMTVSQNQTPYKIKMATALNRAIAILLQSIALFFYKN